MSRRTRGLLGAIIASLACTNGFAHSESDHTAAKPAKPAAKLPDKPFSRPAERPHKPDDSFPGGGPGLHVHDAEEAHVLLEGTARYRIGDNTIVVHAPYVAKVPAGVAHTFINAGTKPFRLVAVFASKRPVTRRIGPNPLIQVEKKQAP